MSEEEKKAIKDFLELREIHSNDSMTISYLSIYQNAVKKMSKLLEKQQKEIEDLKEKNRHLEIDKSQLKAYMETCCIKKTKIEKNIYELKEKAEDVKQKYKGVYAYKDDYLEALAKIEGYQELLEENTNE